LSVEGFIKDVKKVIGVARNRHNKKPGKFGKWLNKELRK